MSFLPSLELKTFLLFVILCFSVCQGQIDQYSLDEFVTVAPNATVCSSTNILADILNSTYEFSWTVDSNNYVNWTWQGLFYPVLGSIQCPRGQGLIFEGVWRCNTDISKTGDKLAALSCPPSANEPTFGPGNTVYCSDDADTLAALTCPDGSILRSNGTAWICGTDNNYLAQVTGCTTGDVLRYTGGVWACGKTANDTDTLKSLIPCPNLYIPKFIGGVWVCALDNDVLRYLNCTAGARVQRSADGTTWVCGPKEQDTFRDITLNCTGINDTPLFQDYGWDCIPTPAINNSIYLGTLLYEWTVTVQSTGTVVTSPSSQLQAYLLPYRGQIRGFQMKVSTTRSTRTTATLFLNGASIYSTTFSANVTTVVGSSMLSIPFAPNSNVTFTLSTAFGGGYVNLGVYAQVLAQP